VGKTVIGLVRVGGRQSRTSRDLHVATEWKRASLLMSSQSEVLSVGAVGFPPFVVAGFAERFGGTTSSVLGAEVMRALTPGTTGKRLERIR